MKRIHRAFCTIITKNYLPYAHSIFISINKFSDDTKFHVLIADDDSIVETEPNNYSTVHPSAMFSGWPIAQELKERYYGADMDKYRWSMKSVFIKYLLEEMGYDKVIYIDSDVHFYSDPSFLFEYLDRYAILLSPHWRSSMPEKDKTNFDLLFVGGIFNGGFIGVNKNGIDAMDWWARMCLYRCEINFSKGQYVDQTYLNLFPVLFDGVKILKHKGCNVANWNQVDCPRVLVGNEVMIDGKWPIVFIHFTKSTIRGIINGSDHMLKPYLDRYLSALSFEGIDLDQDKFQSAEHKAHNKPTIISMLRNKIRGTVHEFFG